MCEETKSFYDEDYGDYDELLASEDLPEQSISQNENEMFVECSSVDLSELEYKENERYDPKSSDEVFTDNTTTTQQQVGCSDDTQMMEPIELLNLDDDRLNELDFDEFIDFCQPEEEEDRTFSEEPESIESQSTSIERQPSSIEPASTSITGNRIVDLSKLFEDIKRLNSSHSKDCNFNDMVLIKETKFGFQSRFTFCCEKCGYLDYLTTTTENYEMPNINATAVLATLSVGLSYSTLVEFSSVFNIPAMTKSTYYKKESEWHTIINEVAEKSMKEIAEIERQECMKEGSVDEVGNALDTCFVDAAWCKRSHRSSYSASSGAATIIGAHTKKVIWNGVANKRCRTCESARSAQTEPRDHKCNKNFSGPSTAMEPKLIKDGFMECESKYKIRFNHFVGDGDASVVVELNNAQIYRYPFLQVDKWECCNHLYKGSRGSMRKLANKAAFKPYLSNDKIEKIIYYIRCSRKHWAESSEPYEVQIENVRKDIFNIVHHISAMVLKKARRVLYRFWWKTN